MRNIPKVFLMKMFILAIVLIFLSVSPVSALAKVFIVTTTPDLADMARNVGGDKVTVAAIARGNQDPHFVEAKPSHMITLKKAALYLVCGLELEIGWSPVLERGSGNPDIRKGAENYVDCSENIRPIEVPSTRIDRSMGDVHPQGNPHYLTDPNNAIIVANTIKKALIKKDPANAKYYKKRYKSYKIRLIKKQIQWLKAMKPFRGVKVVTYHKSWSYFARRFGLNVVGYVEPKPGITPSPAHIARLIKTMKSNNVKILIRANYFESKIPDMICGNTGAKQVVLPLQTGGMNGADTYINMFDLIISRITNALK